MWWATPLLLEHLHCKVTHCLEIAAVRLQIIMCSCLTVYVLMYLKTHQAVSPAEMRSKVQGICQNTCMLISAVPGRAQQKLLLTSRCNPATLRHAHTQEQQSLHYPIGRHIQSRCLISLETYVVIAGVTSNIAFCMKSVCQHLRDCVNPFLT